MANSEHLAILKQGVEAWNRWREEQRVFVGAELDGADLSEIDLRGVDFAESHLREADLSGTSPAPDWTGRI